MYSSAMCVPNSTAIYCLKLFKEIRKACLKWPIYCLMLNVVWQCMHALITRAGTGVVGHFLKWHLYLTFLLLIRNIYINIIHHLKAWNVLFSNFTIEKTELVPYFEKMYVNARCLRRANSVRCWWCRTVGRALSVTMTDK